MTSHLTRRAFLRSAGIGVGAATLSGFPYTNRLALGEQPGKVFPQLLLVERLLLDPCGPTIFVC